MVEEYRLAQARSALERALGTGDQHVIRRSAVTLAHLLEVLGRCQEARRAWQVAQLALRWAELDPELRSADPAVRARAWWSIGWDLQHEHGDPAGAIEAYRKAVGANGHSELALAASMNLGELLAAERDLAGARRAFIRALAIAERMPADDPHSDLAPIARLRLTELAAATG